jgi:chemotaxis protein methyltransferase CheR
VVFPADHVRPGLVDYGPPACTACGGHTECAADPLTAREIGFLRWLLGTAGIDFSHYKPDALRRRIPAVLRAARASTLDRARASLEAQPALKRLAVSAAIIGVTSFFRDQPAFDALGAHLHAYKATAPDEVENRKLRIWSGACSNGAELYSVAILLSELGLLHVAELLGTDCRADAVERAATGYYSNDELAGLSAHQRATHLLAEPGGGRVRPAMRGITQWRTGDLLGTNDTEMWDVILCRNFAIYLSPAAAADLWRRLEMSLRPGGILMLGKAERPLGTKLVNIGPCLYRRSGVMDVA